MNGPLLCSSVIEAAPGVYHREWYEKCALSLAGRAAHLYLPVTHAHLEAGLWEGGGAVEGAAVRERVAGAVPGADDAAVLQRALGERATEVGAALRERVDGAALLH